MLARRLGTPNHTEIPDFEPLPDQLEIPVLLTVDDNVTTDAIMPAGIEGMTLWSNLRGMTDYAFRPIDDSYVPRARDTGDHAVIAGRNYGQGSSREQAALAPRAGPACRAGRKHRAHPREELGELRSAAADLRRS